MSFASWASQTPYRRAGFGFCNPGRDAPDEGTGLPAALRIAVETDRTVYDSVYVALAARERAAVLAADQCLVNALRSGTWAQRVRQLTDLQ